MRLAELQAYFTWLLDGDAEISGIFASSPVPVSRAIEVHRATIEDGFVRVLALGYPTVEALVGDEFFRRMALGYRDTRSSGADATLARYGDDFTNFVMGYEHARSLPYLADVARLDHAIEQCQGSDDEHERFAIDATVSLELPRSLTLLALTFPAIEIRAAIFDKDDGALETLDIAPSRRAAAIWRFGRNVIVSRIAPSAMTFLAMLKGGATPEAALAATASEQAADVLATLQTDVFAAPFARVRPSYQRRTHERKSSP